MVQHDVVGLREQRWITLRDKMRCEQVEFGAKIVPAPISWHSRGSQGEEVGSGVDLSSQAG